MDLMSVEKTRRRRSDDLAEERMGPFRRKRLVFLTLRVPLEDVEALELVVDLLEPDPDAFVTAAGREKLSVRRPSNPFDFALVPLQSHSEVPLHNNKNKVRSRRDGNYRC